MESGGLESNATWIVKFLKLEKKKPESYLSAYAKICLQAHRQNRASPYPKAQDTPNSMQ